MKLLLGGALVASTLAFAAPALATGLSQNPIAIEAVASNPSQPNSFVGSVGVTFRDDAASPATKVTFLVTDAQGHQTTIADDGLFSPGVTVHHDFELSQLGDAASVQVVQVDLEDGSSWSAAPPAEPLASQEYSDLESAIHQPAVE